MSSVNSKYFDAFVKHVKNLSSTKEVEDFFIGILTPHELDQISKRLEIVRRLKKQDPQHEISEDLGVGIATVTRGSKEIKNGRFKNV